MANSKGNAFPNIILSNDSQVFGVDSHNQTHQLSETSFALDLAVSEDGTLWIISNTPDPDGGGSRIYWSNADGNWNEINTPEPGGVQISGGTGSSCYYLTSAGVVRTLDTNGDSTVFDDSSNFISFDYGGGYVWGIFYKNGGIPKLYYSQANALSWQAFSGDPSPMSISVSYAGDCYGIDDSGSPKVYSTDGSTVSSAGSGADDNTAQISSKNWTYLISYVDMSSDGNLVYAWVDTQGGTFEPTTVRAYKVCSTYHRLTS